MAEKSDATPAQLTALLLDGKVRHTFQFFGEEVVMELFPHGVYTKIQQRISGLDSEARSSWYLKLCVAYALRSYGGYKFEDQEERERIIDMLSTKQVVMLAEEYLGATRVQEDALNKKHELLKKSSPGQS